MEQILPIIIAVVLAFLAFRFVAGLVKFAVLGLILVAVALWYTGVIG
jgi:hypothetical protein